MDYHRVGCGASWSHFSGRIRNVIMGVRDIGTRVGLDKAASSIPIRGSYRVKV